MPVCETCQTFFVTPQTFKTLFSFHKICHICETYAALPLHREIIPMQSNETEIVSIDARDHPALTLRAFSVLMETGSLVFFDDEWLMNGEALMVLSQLFKPFRVFIPYKPDFSMIKVLSAL